MIILDILLVLVFVVEESGGLVVFIMAESGGAELTAESPQSLQGQVTMHRGDRQELPLKRKHKQQGNLEILGQTFVIVIILIYYSIVYMQVVLGKCIRGSFNYMRNNLIRSNVTWQTYREC